jgi:ubiquinone/menaquinone biosynthesis C-methylase UbiE
MIQKTPQESQKGRIHLRTKSERADTVPEKKPLGAGGSSLELIDVKALFRQLQLRKGSSFLDIACGRGAYTLAASEFIGPAGALYAVDLWEEGIATLAGEAAARGIKNIVTKVADVGSRIPLEDQTVEVALMATVLHDLVEEGKAEKALRETARVLRPGGVFAVVEFKKIDGPPGPPREVRLEALEVESLVMPFRFKCEKVRDLGPYNYLILFRLLEG